MFLRREGTSCEAKALVAWITWRAEKVPRLVVMRYGWDGDGEEVMVSTAVCVLMTRLEYCATSLFHTPVTRRYGHNAPAL